MSIVKYLTLSVAKGCIKDSMYHQRATEKQLAYLDYLCAELNIINRYRYEYCSVVRASESIDRLYKRLERSRAKARLPKQLSLI